MPSALRKWAERGWRSAMLMGFLGNGIRFGANILLLPVVLHKLSTPEYALWLVFVNLGNFGNLADFGFGAAIPRVYSYLWAGAEDFETEGVTMTKEAGPPNFKRIRQLNVTVQSLYLKLSLGAMSLLAVGGTAYLICKNNYPTAVWGMWSVYLLAIGYNLATSYWMMAAQGLNRMRDMEIAAIFSGLTYVILAAILLLLGAGLWAMVIATLLKGAVMRGMCRRACQQVIPSSEEKETPDPAIIRKLRPNAFKFGILAIGGYLVVSGPLLICKWFLGDQTTVAYGLTVQVGTVLSTVACLWLTVKWPEIAILRTQNRLTEMGVLFARRFGLVMATFVALAGLICLSGNYINSILEWMGKEKRLLSVPCLVFYFAYLTMQVFYVQFGNLIFTENVVPLFKISLFTGLGSVVATVILTWQFGVWGLLTAPLLVEGAYSSWFTVRRGFQGQPLRWRQFCRTLLYRGA